MLEIERRRRRARRASCWPRRWPAPRPSTTCPAMAGVQTNWGLAEERRGDLERAARLPGRAARAVARAARCGASRAGRRSRCATCASASATRPGAQRALAARARAAARQRGRARPSAICATKAPLSGVQRRRFVAWPTHPTHQETP